MSDNMPAQNMLPEEVENEIKKSNIPEEKKGMILRTITEEFSFQGMFKPSNPLAEKLNEEHIGAIINNAELESKRENETRKFTLVILLIAVVIALLFISFIVFIFKNNPEQISPIIVPIVTLVGGYLGGYGHGYKSGTNKN